MATDVNTLGCTYGSGDNTAAFQSAVDLGIPLIVSGDLPCSSIITIDNPATTIEGAGSITIPQLRIIRIGGYTGVAFNTGGMKIMPTADVSGVVFSNFNVSSSYINFAAGAITTGAVFDGITFPAGITPALSWHMNGVEVKNCTIIGPEAPDSTHGAFMLNGCDNLIHDNVFDLRGYRNAVLFGALLGDGANTDYIWKPTCRNNKIYNNTVIGGHEERLSYDGYGGYNSLYTAYVTDITGATITVDLQKSSIVVGTAPASFDGFDMVIVSGTDPGQNFEIQSKTSATVWVLKEIPATLTVGDFVSIGTYFIDNEIYGNTITSPDGIEAGTLAGMTVSGWPNHAVNGTGISLSFGCLNNYVHDNTIDLEDQLFFAGGPSSEWYIPLTGIVNSGIIATSAGDWTDYTPGTLTMQNTRYSMNSRNRIINNHINGNRVPYSAYLGVNSNNPNYAFPQTVLPVGMPWMYDWNGEVSSNTTDSIVFTGEPPAQTQLSYQRDLTYANNSLPPISGFDDWVGLEPGPDNTFIDTTAPTTTATPPSGTAQSVVLTSDDPTATIYYTTDGTTPAEIANVPQGTTQVYFTPISITETTTIKWFGKDTAGNSEAVQTGEWVIDSDVVAANGTSVPTGTSANLSGVLTADNGTATPTGTAAPVTQATVSADNGIVSPEGAPADLLVNMGAGSIRSPSGVLLAFYSTAGQPITIYAP